MSESKIQVHVFILAIKYYENFLEFMIDFLEGWKIDMANTIQYDLNQSMSWLADNVHGT